MGSKLRAVRGLGTAPLIRSPRMTDTTGSEALMTCVNDPPPTWNIAITAHAWPPAFSIAAMSEDVYYTSMASVRVRLRNTTWVLPIGRSSIKSPNVIFGIFLMPRIHLNVINSRWNLHSVEGSFRSTYSLLTVVRRMPILHQVAMLQSPKEIRILWRRHCKRCICAT